MKRILTHAVPNPLLRVLLWLSVCGCASLAWAVVGVLAAIVVFLVFTAGIAGKVS